MNVRQIIAAAALATIGSSVFAAEATQWTPPQGTLTRAQVQAELTKARASGELSAVSADYGSFVPQLAVAKSTSPARDREEVRAEARGSRFNPASLYIGG